jgi:hypothetical protein
MTLLTEATVRLRRNRVERTLHHRLPREAAFGAIGGFPLSPAGQGPRPLRSLRNEGWLLSVRAMFDPQGNAESVLFDTGFAHDIDAAGALEAPSISDASMGTVRFEQAG